jgi:peroxiredoxin Q/BCP
MVSTFKILLLAFVFINLNAKVLQIGDDAPDFILKDQEGFVHNLISHRGSFVLLCFYPRDFTYQARKKVRILESMLCNSLNDKFIVYGISNDPISSHFKFYKKMKISFDLLSDPEENVIKAYNAKGYIENKPLIALIGPDGRIFRIFENMHNLLSSKELISEIIFGSL